MARTSKTTILRQLAAARAHDAAERVRGRRAESASYDRDTGRVMLELSNGFVFGFPARAIPALAKASADELAEVAISPGGGALHWATLDADVSVPGLLLASVDRPSRLRELARLAGRSRSAAKAAAARANGAKGGRPRKAAER
ncbi:MAG: DUF2442 domain-containing protein [Gemmatimonadaceae bacterium]|nr:DUF2442 domain-containing protein [Gemmatimonadaceae bacterium]